MRIVVSLDGSKFAEAVIPQAVALARATHTSITLLQVVTPPNTYVASVTTLPEDWYTNKVQAIREYLNAVAKGIQALGIEAQIAMIDGHATQGILTYVEQHSDISLLAMASYGRDSVGRWFLGSVAADIIQELPKPLLVIHPDEQEMLQNRAIPAYHTIVIPLDGSARAEHSFEYSKPLAKTFGASFMLVQVPSMPDTEANQDTDYLEQKAQQLRAEGFTVQTRPPFANASALIERMSEVERGDVLMVATHRKKIEGVVMDFIRHVGVPVLLVPHR